MIFRYYRCTLRLGSPNAFKEGQRTLVSVAKPGWQMIICLICW